VIIPRELQFKNDQNIWVFCIHLSDHGNLSSDVDVKQLVLEFTQDLQIFCHVRNSLVALSNISFIATQNGVVLELIFYSETVANFSSTFDDEVLDCILSCLSDKSPSLCLSSGLVIAAAAYSLSCNTFSVFRPMSQQKTTVLRKAKEFY